MAITLSTGAKLYIASTYGASKTMSALTNATSAVATLEASHGVIVGDIVEVTSGWGLLNYRLARASNVATNDVTLEAIDTSSTSRYPTGTGTGSVREITAWTEITQISGASTNGGDLNFANVTTLADQVEKQLPTTRSAIQLNFDVFDDPTLSWYSVVNAASETNALTALRIVFANNSVLYANGYFSLQTTPALTINAPLTSSIGFSTAAQPTRYSS